MQEGLEPGGQPCVQRNLFKAVPGLRHGPGNLCKRLIAQEPFDALRRCMPTLAKGGT
ncbi:hypothetical protein A176_006876 [Myxococcus hansupus]|uniref:Uncharacterized protein n=1 Tax=Pseudomyxococcus hansupus TaxID=1297742 RepID=A0A0H4X441_9BACT|nr:hypothetical protein A176_006876 [Myxococcus hansupus]